MRKLVYLMNLSLDGFVEGPDGKFDWSFPTDEVLRFHNDQAASMSTFLYGRRMYETMKIWHTLEDHSGLPQAALEYARIWRGKEKVVFSKTLTSVGDGCRLVSGNAAEEVARLKSQSGGDIGVSGPTLANDLAHRGLVDEFRLVVCPVLVGGGKPYFPRSEAPVPLRLVETRPFENGALYLRYVR